MLVKKKTLQPKSKRNLFLQVERYSDDQRFIAGSDIETGEKVWVTLTDKGHYASNKMRPTVADFANPNKNVYVAPGGVIVCARAFNFDGSRPDAFASTWLNVAASNADMARKNIVFNQDCSFTIHMNKLTGRSFGCVTLWRRDKTFEAHNFDDLRRKLCEDIDKTPNFRSGFVIRGMNQDNQVIGYEYFETRYNTAESRVQNGLEAITYVESEPQFKELGSLDGFVKYDVLPATLHTVSPRRFESKEDSFKSMETLYWTEDKVAALARKTTMVLAKEGALVKQIYPHTYGHEETYDPALMNKEGFYDCSPAFSEQIQQAYAEARADRKEHVGSEKEYQAPTPPSAPKFGSSQNNQMAEPTRPIGGSFTPPPSFGQ